MISVASIASLLFGFFGNDWASSSHSDEGKYVGIFVLLTFIVGLSVVFVFVFVMHSPILMEVYKDMIKGALFASLNYFESTPMAKII